MATSLGKVGIVGRGNYLQEEIYNAGDFVLYNGSTWIALKDGILGVEPAEGTEWKYLARGFEAEVLSLITANDTSGLIGEVGQQVNAQSLIDVIADKVANRLIDKGLIANNLVTDNTEMVLAAPMGKELKRQLDEQNKNIINNFQIMQHRPYNSAALNEFNIDNFAGNWIAGFTDVGEGTFPEKRWQNIVQFDTGHFENQISMQSSFGNGYLPEIHLRSKYAGGENQSWTNWNKIVTNSDLGEKYRGLGNPYTYVDNADGNTLVNNGWHVISTNINSPITTETQPYWVFVITDNVFIRQIWISKWFNNIYQRHCNIPNGWVWSSFKEM